MALKGVGRRVEVSDEDRCELERIVRAVSSEVRMVERARIVLAAAEGMTGRRSPSGGVLAADSGQVARAVAELMRTTLCGAQGLCSGRSCPLYLRFRFRLGERPDVAPRVGALAFAPIAGGVIAFKGASCFRLPAARDAGREPRLCSRREHPSSGAHTGPAITPRISARRYEARSLALPSWSRRRLGNDVRSARCRARRWLKTKWAARLTPSLTLGRRAKTRSGSTSRRDARTAARPSQKRVERATSITLPPARGTTWATLSSPARPVMGMRSSIPIGGSF